jgi:hypothetical protein
MTEGGQVSPRDSISHAAASAILTVGNDGLATVGATSDRLVLARCGCCSQGWHFRGAMIPTSAMITSAPVAVLVSASPCAAQSRQAVILRPPISPACTSSPFGPRVLSNQPQAGSYHDGIDLPAPAGALIVATAPGKVIRIQRKGPGGLEILVQHDGFVAIYSHLGMAAPAFAQRQKNRRGRREVRCCWKNRSHCRHACIF